MVGFTDAQIQRLRELGDGSHDGVVFVSAAERDREFARAFSALEAANARRFGEMLERPRRHGLPALEAKLADALVSMGFVEVRTPTMISMASLEKMGVGEGTPLGRQVFRVGDKRCLRPMLAPSLYMVMRKFRDFTDGPVRIFEIGSCFRKESRSNVHLDEFTMLNLVELGPEGDASERLLELIAATMGVLGLGYETVETESEVYRSTVDVEVGGEEMASGAVGPHFLDPAHGIDEPWCGVGFGLERLLAAIEGRDNVKKMGRSISYLNGAKID
ncbi:MAG: hypothetical protein GX224_06195 [Thermoplasmatales archaeon]|nr:hypothetical protein [Thermoplasmatales archaeon]